MIASIRPDDWNWLLLFHLLFAFALVGGVTVVVLVSLAAERKAWPEQVPLLRAIAFRTNLVVVIPAFIAIHVFGGLLSDREYNGHEPDWLSISFTVTSAATIVAVVLTFLQFWVLRRVRAGQLGGWQTALVAYLPVVILAALLSVIVLMAGKPVA
jgi:hypothetical protein